MAEQTANAGKVEVGTRIVVVRGTGAVPKGTTGVVFSVGRGRTAGKHYRSGRFWGWRVGFTPDVPLEGYGRDRLWTLLSKVDIEPNTAD